MHSGWVVCMVVADNANIEAFLSAFPFQVLGDLLLSLQQLPNKIRVELIVESWVFLLVLQFLYIVSQRIQAIIDCS